MKFKKILIAVLLIVILTFTFVACKKDIEINGFSINLSKVSLDIEQGTDFDFSKVEVNATRVDDTSILLTQGVDYTIDIGDFNKDVPGEYTIAVNYGSYATKYFIVKVNAPQAAVTVNGIVIEGATQKTSFAYNENFNYNGLAVKVFYSDYTSTIITEGYTVDSTEYNKAHGSSSSRDYLIVVNFGGKSTTYSVSVAADPNKVMKRIEAVGKKKTQYKYFEDFTSEGLELKITMMDDSTTTITGGFEVDSTAFNKLHGMGEAQTYNIKLSYMSLETNYDVVVAKAKVVNLAVVASKEDKTFKYNEMFSLKNVKVYAQYENSDYQEELTAAESFGVGKFVASGTYNKTHGQSSAQEYNIYINYSEIVSTHYIVTVAALPEFVGFAEGKGSTQKTVFAENDAFDLTGLILEVVYGSTENEDLYVRTAEANEYRVECESFDSSVKGYYPVYVLYNSTNYLLYSVYVDIPDGSNAVSILANIYTNTYYVKQPINYSGSYITVFYDNSPPTDIYLPNSAVTVTGFSSETPGIIELTITFGELTTTVENIQIIEDDIVYIQFGENSNQRFYFYFLENFNSEGLVVKAIWQSNRVTTLNTSEYSVNIDNYKAYEDNFYTIEVSYEKPDQSKLQLSYVVRVMSYSESREPESIYYNINDKNYDAVKVSDGNWTLCCGAEGEGNLEISLGEDNLSSVSVMLGRYFVNETFLELQRNPMGKFVINYDGETSVELTIRITTAAGTVYYNYVTIKQSLFNYFVINGEQVIFNSNNNAYYTIKNISNTYAIDWEVNEAYTVNAEIIKLNIYTLKGFNSSDWCEIYVKIDDDTTIRYTIKISAFKLVNSVSVNNEAIEIDENGKYFVEWSSYDINGDYSFAINAYYGYTATLEYSGISKSSINGNILFAGANFFDIVIKDSHNSVVTTYQLTIFIEISAYSIFENAYISEADFQTQNLYYLGSEWNLGYIATISGDSIARSDIKVTFSLVAGATISIEGISWSNGESINLVPGKNEFILTLCNGVNTYRTYLIIYYQVNQMSFWNSHDVTFNGVSVERTDTVPNQDTAIIKIPNGFVYDNTNIENLIVVENRVNSFISEIYNLSINNGQIVIEVGYIDNSTQEYVLIGFGYIIVMIDGQVNADINLDFYIIPIINLANETMPDTTLPFTLDAQSGNYLASVELPEVAFMFFEAPYFATVDFTCDTEEAIQYMGDMRIYFITGMPDDIFTLTFVVTSSDGTTTATYILSITIVASPKEFAFDFGTEDTYEYGLIDFLFVDEGQLFINVPLEGLGESVLDTENLTASFIVISDKIYVEDGKDLVKVTSGEVASYTLKETEVEGIYYVEFIYFLDYEANPDIMLTVYVSFGYEQAT